MVVADPRLRSDVLWCVCENPRRPRYSLSDHHLVSEATSVETGLKQSLVAPCPPSPPRGWEEATLLAHTEAELATAVLTDPPVWSGQWKEIKQHISASLQLLCQSFRYCCSAEYRWEYPAEERPVVYSFTKEASKIVVHDILCYGYAGSMYGLYNFLSRDGSCCKIVIHNGLRSSLPFAAEVGGGLWD